MRGVDARRAGLASVQFVSTHPDIRLIPQTDAASATSHNSPFTLHYDVLAGVLGMNRRNYVLAGSQPAVVDGTRVVGTWRRLLWALSQTLQSSDTGTRMYGAV